MIQYRVFIACLAAWLCLPLAARAGDPEPVQFNRDVLPILSDHCFACHGPDKKQRKADLRLDERASAIELGAVTPGNLEESELAYRIDSSDPDEMMPPPESNKPLSTAQKSILKQWIEQGARYDAHWSYAPITRPAVPTPRSTALVHNPIDAFIQSALETKKLSPAPEAGRAALLRRLSLDLTGLPPSPEEVRGFVEDREPGAYERQVDRLLKSPRYGERMAVPWLDAVRYADTVGFHGDQNMNAWFYRDYVIDAFNSNKPFDQFTIEQLSGDLLPDATPEQRAATCFVRLNMMTREGGAQPKEYLAKYAADRVRTVGMAWLGSTLACCECHDHKFDPFSTRDFYSLAAFFADVKQWGVYADYGYTPNPDLRGWGNDHPFAPEINIESPALKRRIALLENRIAEVVSAADARLEADETQRLAYESWRSKGLSFLRDHPEGWLTPRPTWNRDSKVKREIVEVEDNGILRFKDKDATNDEILIQPGAGRVATVRVEIPPDPEGKILRGDTEEMLLRVGLKLRKAKAKAAQSLSLLAADADRSAPRYRSSFALIGILEGWKVDASLGNNALTGLYVLETPVTLAEDDALIVVLSGNRAARLRVSVSPFIPPDLKHPISGSQWLSALEGQDEADQALASAAYLRATGWDKSALEQVRKLDEQVRECRDGMTPVMVVETVAPAVTRVLPRGNWQDESGEVVLPAPPHFLPHPKDSASRERLTRLDLAHWLVAPENPLTARVFVNRLWKQMLGAGLSPQVDDLGAQGEAPSHPELLDWLANEFRGSGWDVKHMVRLIATSHAYRQESNPSARAREADPSNRFLASQSPRRLEAEFIRDNALSIAGLIDLELGGPPCKPYQPAGYYANLQFPDRFYQPDADERQYRRGVYMHWQRTFLHPMLANFDAPSREDCVVARTQANSPQQALTLLNDPEFVEAARVFAASLLTANAKDDAERLGLAYQRALARPIQAKELASLLPFLAQARDAAREGKDDARLLKVGNAPVPANLDSIELSAWTEAARVILNLHETITRY